MRDDVHRRVDIDTIVVFLSGTIKMLIIVDKTLSWSIVINTHNVVSDINDINVRMLYILGWIQIQS